MVNPGQGVAAAPRQWFAARGFLVVRGRLSTAELADLLETLERNGSRQRPGAPAGPRRPPLS